MVSQDSETIGFPETNQIDVTAHSRPKREYEATTPAAAAADPQADPVEAALGEALERASAAGQWNVVATLARELQARREARAGVVERASERKRRRG